MFYVYPTLKWDGMGFHRTKIYYCRALPLSLNRKHKFYKLSNQDINNFFHFLIATNFGLVSVVKNTFLKVKNPTSK